MAALLPALAPVVAAALATSPARAASGDLYLCGHVGFATQALSDINRVIDADERIYRSYGVPARFNGFGGAPVFALESGVRLTPVVSLGLGVEAQSDRVTNGYTDPASSYSDRIDLRLVEAAGFVTYWLPTVTGAYFGSQVGLGFGRMREKVHFRHYANPTDDYDVSSDFHGSGVTLGFFGGYEQPVATSASLGVRAGYRHLNLGTFEGSSTHSKLGYYSGPPRDRSGAEMDSDWSGIYVAASFDVLLRAR